MWKSILSSTWMTLSVGVLVGDSVFSFSSFLMEMRMEIWTFFVFLFFLFRSSFPDCSSDVSEDLDSFRRLFWASGVGSVSSIALGFLFPSSSENGFGVGWIVISSVKIKIRYFSGCFCSACLMICYSIDTCSLDDAKSSTCP